MIREWCDQCGARFEPGFVDFHGVVRPGRCPYACDLGVSDLPEWPTCDVAELFWTAIAHERAECECLVKEARSEGLEEGLRRGPGPVVRFPEYFGYNDGPVVEEEEGEG